ncbi:hypothetical protein SDJN02_13541, partial [Cucurbita argyrosperma subsp. argyrosperma]
MYLIGPFSAPPPSNGSRAYGGPSINENQEGRANKYSVFDQIAFSFHPPLPILLSPAHAGCSHHHRHRNSEADPAAIHDAKEARVRTATMEKLITKLEGGFSMAARRSKKQWEFKSRDKTLGGTPFPIYRFIRNLSNTGKGLKSHHMESQ